MSFIPGTISSFVAWHVSRGSTLKRILASAAKYHSTFAADMVTSEYSYQKQTARYAGRFDTFSDSTKLSVLRPPSRTGENNMVSVCVEVDITVPGRDKIKRIRAKTYCVDFATTASVGDVRNWMMGVIRRDLSRFYNLENFSGSRQQMRITTTSVNSI